MVKAGKHQKGRLKTEILFSDDLSGVTESIAKNGKAAVVQIHSRLDDGLSGLLAGWNIPKPFYSVAGFVSFLPNTLLFSYI